MLTKIERPASAKGIRENLLNAARLHPELRGWKAAICGPIDRVPTTVYLEAPDNSLGWFRCFGDVRRDTLAGLQRDAADLASKAAAQVRESRSCPMCASFPLLCEFHGAQNVLLSRDSSSHEDIEDADVPWVPAVGDEVIAVGEGARPAPREVSLSLDTEPTADLRPAPREVSLSPAYAHAPGSMDAYPLGQGPGEIAFHVAKRDLA